MHALQKHQSKRQVAMHLQQQELQGRPVSVEDAVRAVNAQLGSGGGGGRGRGSDSGGASGSGAGRGGGGGGSVSAPPVPPTMPVPLPAPPPNPAEGEADDGGEEFSAAGEADARGAGEVATPWLPGIGDTEIKYAIYTNTTTGKDEPHWKLRCHKEGHGNCEKRHGDIPMFCRRFGAVEPFAWLYAWHEIDWPTHPGKPTHRSEFPNALGVARWVTDHGAELQELVDRSRGML